MRGTAMVQHYILAHFQAAHRAVERGGILAFTLKCGYASQRMMSLLPYDYSVAF